MQAEELTAFLSAVQIGDSAKVKRHLHIEGPDQESRDIEQSSQSGFPANEGYCYSITWSEWLEALWISESKSDAEILQLLLDCDRFTRGVFENGQTILHLAVNKYSDKGSLNKLPELTRILLHSKKVDPRIVDDFGETALALAAKNDFSDVASSIFIEMLLTATKNGDTDTIRLLDQIYCDSKPNVVEAKTTWCWEHSQILVVTVSTPNAISSNNCFRAAKIATEHSSNCILELILDCKFFKDNYRSKLESSQDASNDLLHDVCLSSLDLEFLCSLLKCENFDASSVDVHSQTALHYIGLCRNRSAPDSFSEITTSLLEHNVNANRKDYKGQTALMMACSKGKFSIILAMIEWAKRSGISLDLDCQDIYGQTALMKAAYNKRSAAVEMLIDAGASVHLSDNRGFTVLHHALYEPIEDDLWILFYDNPRDFNAFRSMIKDIGSFNLDADWGNKSNSKGKHTIVEKLLQQETIDTNSLDCEGYSPMDIAFITLSDIESDTVKIMEKKGARLSVLQPENNETACNTVGTKGLTKLHRLCLILVNASLKGLLQSYTIPIMKKYFAATDQNLLRQLCSEKDSKGRTALHLAATIEFWCFQVDEFNLVEILLSMGCNINETDSYGRTPLHYANEPEMREFLTSYGADATIKDKNGLDAKEMHEILDMQCAAYDGKISTAFHADFDAIVEIISDIKEGGKYDLKERRISSLLFQHKLSDNYEVKNKLIIDKLTHHALRDQMLDSTADDVKDFVEQLAAHIEILDNRFKVSVIPVGSAYEGTKEDRSDEYDFGFVLAKFSQFCEVSPSPEIPLGFVHLKIKQDLIDKDEFKDFVSFFDTKGSLKTQRLNMEFSLLMTRVLRDTNFITIQHKFDWDYPLSPQHLTSDYEDFTKIFKTITLTKTNLSTVQKRPVVKISIDIVPYIHIDNWWPDEALTDDDNIKTSGCYLVLNGPEKYYPWIPYSGSYARITFAPFESEIIKQSSNAARTAYIIGKTMMKHLSVSCKDSSTGKLNGYILKTCLLYCIEAFTVTAEKASNLELSVEELKSCFEQLDVQFWLETIMKCYLDFCLRDFCPCYFMPSFHIPINTSLKHEHVLLCQDAFNAQFVIGRYAIYYFLYFLVSLDENDQQITVNPFWEDFNRQTLLSKLSTLAITKLTNFKSNSVPCENDLPSFVDDICEDTSKMKSDSEVIYSRI